jgi:SAM-dependent methyltransferase
MEPNLSEAAMWDERYSIDDHLFGVEPAEFLTRNAHLLEPEATALVVADGEGRNSVFLAEQGLQVTAMDVSTVGVEKARALAASRQVSPELLVADILTWEWTPDAHDVVVAVFIQFLAPAERSAVFEGLQRTLRPGGRLLLHGYRSEQLQYGTGGPPDPERLYTEALLAESFADLDIEVLHGYDAVIEEGAGHAGPSALIDLVARKR